jgi:hypothetical protein
MSPEPATASAGPHAPPAAGSPQGAGSPREAGSCGCGDSDSSKIAETLAPGPAPFDRGAASTAQTVKPTSSVRTPQVLHRCSTMRRPRPLIDDGDGCPACGTVGLPPSLTATSTELALTSQATCSRSPGSGYACSIALLKSSLMTRTASATAWSNTPAARSSSESALRARATLAGAHGRWTIPDFLTSLTARPGNQRHTLPAPQGFRCPNLLCRKPTGNEAMVTSARQTPPCEWPRTVLFPACKGLRPADGPLTLAWPLPDRYRPKPLRGAPTGWRG